MPFPLNFNCGYVSIIRLRIANSSNCNCPNFVNIFKGTRFYTAQKLKFLLRISLVNVNKSTGSFGYIHIYLKENLIF